MLRRVRGSVWSEVYITSGGANSLQIGQYQRVQNELAQ